jgi:hypothetical protein
MAFLSTSVFSIATRSISTHSTTADQLSESLTTIMVVVAISAALLGLAAFLASRAVRMLDETFSPE